MFHPSSFVLGVLTSLSFVTVLMVNNLYQRSLEDKKQPKKSSTENVDDRSVVRLQTSVLHELNRQFQVSADVLKSIQERFLDEIKKGLEKEGQTVAMIPSYVTKAPTGQESGSYLALDVGGSNFRTCWVDMKGDHKLSTIQKKFVIPEELKTGKGVHLFDFFADCVLELLNEYRLVEQATEQLRLGFTFSFPCAQTAIQRGALMRWTKGFTCPDVVGQDPVQLLQEAFHRKNLPIHVAALVNDTVGTLIAHAYVDPRTKIAVILGTGTNAAYSETIDRIPKWKGKKNSKLMYINMEWGAFDEEGVILPRTKYDDLLDEASAHPHTQPFEKMISGMYLGEIARLVMLDLTNEGKLFSGHVTRALETPYSFETAFITQILRDPTENLSETIYLLKTKFQLSNLSPVDGQLVYHICHLVGQRAARLVATGIAATLLQMKPQFKQAVDEFITVGIDGSVYEFLPDFKEMMQIALEQILGHATAKRITLSQARDGSSSGAALIACLMK